MLDQSFFPLLNVQTYREYFWELWSSRNLFHRLPINDVFEGKYQKWYNVKKVGGTVTEETSEGADEVGLENSSSSSSADSTGLVRYEPDEERANLVRLPPVLQTICRFRPKECFKETKENTNETKTKVTIPLHQRVAYFQSKNPGISKSKAQFMVMQAERAAKGIDAGMWGNQNSNNGCADTNSVSTVPGDTNSVTANTDDVKTDSATVRASDSSTSSGSSEAAAQTAQPDSSSTLKKEGDEPKKPVLRASLLGYDEKSVLTLAPGVGVKGFEFDYVRKTFLVSLSGLNQSFWHVTSVI